MSWFNHFAYSIANIKSPLVSGQLHTSLILPEVEYSNFFPFLFIFFPHVFLLKILGQQDGKIKAEAHSTYRA